MWLLAGFITSLFALDVLAQPCDPHTVADHSNSSFTDVKKLTRETVSASIAYVEEDLQNQVKGRLARFEVDFVHLARGEFTAENVAQWYMNMVNLNKIALEEINRAGILNQTEAGRLALSMVNTIVSGWLTKAASTALHEKGHGQAAEKLGAHSVSYRTPGGKDMSLGNLFLHLIARGGGARTRHEHHRELSATERAAISAGGFNQQIHLSLIHI